MTEKQRAIRELQQRLRNIQKSGSDAAAVIPDGIYSAETRAYVESFQRENGLPVTGVVDLVTWEAIREADRLVTRRSLTPIQVAPISNEDFPLAFGDDNKFTDTVRLMLNHLAEKYRSFDFVDEGAFGEAMREGVIRWQRVTFLSPTGEVDRETWDSLAEFYLL